MAEPSINDELQVISSISRQMPGALIRIVKDSSAWKVDYIGEGTEPLLGCIPKTDSCVEEIFKPAALGLFMDHWEQFVDTVENDGASSFVTQIGSGPNKGRWLKLYASGENVSGLVLNGIITDVTREKAKELDLERSHNILQASIKESPAGVLIAEAPDVKIIVANPAALGTRKGEVEELVGIDVDEHKLKWQTYHPDGSPYDPIDLPLSRAVMKGEKTTAEELIIRDEWGNNRNIIANASPVFNSEGEVEVGVVMWNDITNLKNAEKEIIAEKNRLEFAMNAGKMGSWEVDLNSMTIVWFGRTETVFDRNAEDLPVDFESFLEVIYEEDREMLVETVMGTKDSGKPLVVEHRILDSKNEIRWLKAVGQITEWDGTTPRIMSGIVFDVSDVRKAENELKVVHEQLEALVEERTQSLREANEDLEAFAYSVSHDLRSPLRGIDGFSLAILEDYQSELDESGNHYLKRIRSGVNRMSELIDDILKISKVRRHKVQNTNIDLSNISKEVFKDLCSMNVERTVTCDVEPNMQIKGDEQLVKVLLENLLGNAWKYTRKNPDASIGVSKKEDDEGNQVVSIRDNGVGFNPKFSDKLFQPFQRLHTDQEFKGSGIGLATVQRIIGKHGWEISAEGEEGVGATFNIKIPKE